MELSENLVEENVVAQGEAEEDDCEGVETDYEQGVEWVVV